MKIGVLGGTFNPIHKGHIKICKKVKDKLELDKVILIPSFISPHKKDMIIPGPDIRKHMIKLAIAEENGFEIDEFEINRDRISYSIDTIRYLKKKYRNDKIFWIIGTDLLFHLEEWYDFQNVLSEIGFIVILRDAQDLFKVEEYIEKLKKTYGARIEMCNMKTIDISSTKIRNKVKKGEAFKEDVHKNVEKYIIEENLYK